MKSFIINIDNYNKGNNNTSHMEEMWIYCNELKLKNILLSLFFPIISFSFLILHLHVSSFRPDFYLKLKHYSRSHDEVEKYEELMKRRRTLSAPSEKHVVVVRRPLGCGASKRQAVIGWNVHQ